MKQFLINTPLKISWKANFGSLQKSDLSLSLENPIVVISIADFEIDDDKVVFSFGVEDQKYGGKYDAVLRNSSGDIIDVAAAIDLIPNEHNNTLGQNDVITVEPDYGGGSPGPSPSPTSGLKVIVSTADWALISADGAHANTKAEAAEIAGISEEELDLMLDSGAYKVAVLFAYKSGEEACTAIVKRSYDPDDGQSHAYCSMAGFHNLSLEFQPNYGYDIFGAGSEG